MSALVPLARAIGPRLAGAAAEAAGGLGARTAGRGALSAIGRAALTAGGLAAVDATLDAVNDWLDAREWQQGRARHRGVDLPCPVGTPVISPADCVVIGQQQTDDGGQELFLSGERAFRTAGSADADRWPRPARWFAPGTLETGRDTMVTDDSGWRFGFSHLGAYNCRVGEIVGKGQQVATTGRTGKVTGPHLHLTTFWVQDEIRDVTTFVDPALLIPGIQPSVPRAPIGPGAWLTVCIFTRVSTREQAASQCVVQQIGTGLALNWAATLQGVR